MTIRQILDRVHPLPEINRLALESLAEPVRYPRGHLLLPAYKVAPCLFFIGRGIARAYAATADNEITFWFGREGDPVISMKSYVSDEPGYEHIELLEDSELYRVDTKALRRLYEQDAATANWGRRFAERELVKTEERLIARQFKTAKERYCALLEDNPDLLQRVALGHIASYLGITQVSLSRIRAELR